MKYLSNRKAVFNFKLLLCTIIVILLINSFLGNTKIYVSSVILGIALVIDLVHTKIYPEDFKSQLVDRNPEYFRGWDSEEIEKYLNKQLFSYFVLFSVVSIALMVYGIFKLLTLG